MRKSTLAFLLLLSINAFAQYEVETVTCNGLDGSDPECKKTLESKEDGALACKSLMQDKSCEQLNKSTYAYQMCCSSGEDQKSKDCHQLGDKDTVVCTGPGGEKLYYKQEIPNGKLRGDLVDSKIQGFKEVMDDVGKFMDAEVSAETKSRTPASATGKQD